MRSPVALFCYNRLDSLQQTVAALQANPLAAETDLFIFSDGPKNQTGAVAVNAVREYIKTISGFKSVTVKEAPKNQGLANSIIAGVTEVVNKYGKIIVIEDDIVTAPYFLQWMNDALDMYEHEEKVAGIQAWTPPEEFGQRPDTYFIREVGCWGWATWKRGWDIFEADGRKLLKQFNSPQMIREFDVYGSYPYHQMLQDQADGCVDSWAIRWYASVFLKGKLGLQPGKTLVSNVGYQSGTHFKSDCSMKPEVIGFEPPNLNSIPLCSAEDVLKRVYVKYNRRFDLTFMQVIKKYIKRLLTFAIRPLKEWR